MKRLSLLPIFLPFLALIFGSCNSSLKMTKNGFYLQKKRVKVTKNNRSNDSISKTSLNKKQSLASKPAIEETNQTPNQIELADIKANYKIEDKVGDLKKDKNVKKVTFFNNKKLFDQLSFDKLQKSKNKDEAVDKSDLSTVGGVLLIAGLVVVVFVSVLIGAIISFIGLVLILLGAL